MPLQGARMVTFWRIVDDSWCLSMWSEQVAYLNLEVDWSRSISGGSARISSSSDNDQNMACDVNWITWCPTRWDVRYRFTKLWCKISYAGNKEQQGYILNSVRTRKVGGLSQKAFKLSSEITSYDIVVLEVLLPKCMMYHLKKISTSTADHGGF